MLKHAKDASTIHLHITGWTYNTSTEDKQEEPNTRIIQTVAFVGIWRKGKDTICDDQKKKKNKKQNCYVPYMRTCCTYIVGFQVQQLRHTTLMFFHTTSKLVNSVSISTFILFFCSLFFPCVSRHFKALNLLHCYLYDLSSR